MLSYFLRLLCSLIKTDTALLVWLIVCLQIVKELVCQLHFSHVKRNCYQIGWAAERMHSYGFEKPSEDVERRKFYLQTWSSRIDLICWQRQRRTACILSLSYSAPSFLILETGISLFHDTQSIEISTAGFHHDEASAESSAARSDRRISSAKIHFAEFWRGVLSEGKQSYWSTSPNLCHERFL